MQAKLKLKRWQLKKLQGLRDSQNVGASTTTQGGDRLFAAGAEVSGLEINPTHIDQCLHSAMVNSGQMPMCKCPDSVSIQLR